jgi:hypothetical protein
VLPTTFVWIDEPVDYYGYRRKPIWDPVRQQWGFYLFGVWIPVAPPAP